MLNRTLLDIYHKFQNCFKFQQKLVWKNVFAIFFLHILFVYISFSVVVKSRSITMFWDIFVGQLSAIGVSLGAHRLWTHRSYKAKLPLRIFLMLCYVTAGQYSLVQWARDHRLHHKYSDTDADPHNSNRGFFFSHCGWLMMKRHPDVKDKGKSIDLSDLWNDPVVRFQQKYFVPLSLIFFVILPIVVPPIFWNESWITSVQLLFFFRYVLQLNLTWIVNSVAHFFGTKPYNKNINAVQNKFVAIFAWGEGWHNYHHAFPWDYRIGEYGQGYQTGAWFIEQFETLGLAYDLKYASTDMIRKVVAKSARKEEAYGTYE